MAEPTEVPMEMEMNLPATVEVGAHADFAMVWHTPNSFVLDFVAIKRPPQIVVDEATKRPMSGKLEATIAARVRIPPEQVFPLMNALKTQGDAWLAETGRSAPPEGWLPPEGIS